MYANVCVYIRANMPLAANINIANRDAYASLGARLQPSREFLEISTRVRNTTQPHLSSRLFSLENLYMV